MPDAGGCYLLPRLVGLHRAKELLFLGDDCPADEADRIGLVNRVVPAAELDATVDELARRFLALPTKAIALTKRLANRSFESSREQSFDDEALFQELVVDHRRLARGHGRVRRASVPRVPGLVSGPTAAPAVSGRSATGSRPTARPPAAATPTRRSLGT